MVDERWKKVVFYEREHNSAELKIRLRYDMLTQGDFFRFIIQAYLTQDPRMLDLISDMKMVKSSMGTEKIKDTKREIKLGKNLKANLGLTPEDKENIYDILEGGEWDWE